MWESKTRCHRFGCAHDQNFILFVHGVTYKDLSELEKQIKYLSPCCVQQRVFGTLCSAFELSILHLQSCSFLAQKMFTVLSYENENTGLGSEAVSCQG